MSTAFKSAFALPGFDPTAPGGLAAVLAFHRRHFGDARMEDDPADKPDDKPSDDPADKPDDQLGDAGKKALEAERAAAKKEKKRAADLERELNELKNRDKSEAERNADRLKELESLYAKSELKSLRLEIATELSVPADLLAGDDEDAMREHAKKLLEFRGAPDKGGASGSGTRKKDPSQGSRGGASKGGDGGRAEAAKRFGQK